MRMVAKIVSFETLSTKKCGAYIHLAPEQIRSGQSNVEPELIRASIQYWQEYYKFGHLVNLTRKLRGLTAYRFYRERNENK
ncbi:uncharacterized protein PHALS_14696 [Plasmopara halstedii]|uniref:Uncharacterized protein n=1 Tax=Plasmopara halstedii TaxID=4781 RepID=A0A0P1AQ27_PLAHL|nr:uncharacterized protein PHALS_14696 [Plasmopara halstedii]CEG43264.1 hypothetical protein PHALS_14696 [Plasmopara halstedii]|eukprot:XP_024579633.1 hypothetical protein PHALS_14696 [Plasmopara halstedii]